MHDAQCERPGFQYLKVFLKESIFAASKNEIKGQMLCFAQVIKKMC